QRPQRRAACGARAQPCRPARYRLRARLRQIGAVDSGRGEPLNPARLQGTPPTMTNRITDRFAAARAENRPALVAYVMAGDPDLAAAQQSLDALPRAGADVIELGMPFSDPMADGPSGQAAGQRALKSGQTLARTLGMVEAFRRQDA